MNVEYDKKSDARYIQFQKGKIAETKEEQDWLLFDYAKNGEILGVEILDASKHPVTASVIDGKLVELSLPENYFFGGMWEDISTAGKEKGFSIFSPTLSQVKQV